MVRQEEIGLKLAQGSDPDEIADASNVRAEPVDHDDYDAVILSYGWAIIFARRRQDGRLVEFTGWRGYSNSTSTQMGKIRHKLERSRYRDADEEHRKPHYDGANPLNSRVQREDTEPL